MINSIIIKIKKIIIKKMYIDSDITLIDNICHKIGLLYKSIDLDSNCLKVCHKIYNKNKNDILHIFILNTKTDDIIYSQYINQYDIHSSFSYIINLLYKNKIIKEINSSYKKYSELKCLSNKYTIINKDLGNVDSLLIINNEMIINAYIEFKDNIDISSLKYWHKESSENKIYVNRYKLPNIFKVCNNLINNKFLIKLYKKYKEKYTQEIINFLNN